jgi:hypothetical protein
MGLLEKLGLRSSKDKEFSLWLGEHIPLLTDGDEAMLEVDRGVTEFVGRHGEDALVRAIDAWIDRTDRKRLVRGDLTLFINDEGWKLVLNGFRERHQGAGGGLVVLDQTLIRLGVLQTRYNILKPESLGEFTPVEAMGLVIWPLSRKEGEVRRQLHALTGDRTDKPTEELVALRFWAMFAVAGHKFAEAPAEAELLIQKVLGQVEKLATEPQKPSTRMTFLDKRWGQYGEALQPRTVGGATIDPSGTHAIGRLFARHFGTESIAVREFGARQFAEAHDTLGWLVDQYKAAT